MHAFQRYIKFPNSGKSIKLNSTPDNKIRAIGLSKINNYNGHEYTFD